MDFHIARNNMIEQQVRPWDVLDQRVLDVLAEIARDNFVEPRFRAIAYSDYCIPIGFGQHMLKPTQDGRMLQALSLQVTDHVLEIGTGSGYLTMCLSRLAASVESIELIPELAARADQRLSNLGVANVQIRHKDAAQTWDARDQYDAILFSGAIPSVPEFYRNKLAVGGRLVGVLGDPQRPTMEARLITRVGQTEWSQESLFETRIDPLMNFASDKPDFIF